MIGPRLNPKPDWPDRSRWIHSFNAQMLHDYDGPYRVDLPWSQAEDQDLLDQRSAGVAFLEIARRHQRTWENVASRHQVLLWRLEKRLLR